MSKRVNKYPCGKCGKNVNKSSKAVLCMGVCAKWYHFKECTNLTDNKYELIRNGDLTWTCVSCQNLDNIPDLRSNTETCSLFSEPNEEHLDIEINKLLTQEVESQRAIIDLLKDDLEQARQEIKNLKNLVLEREEEIVELKQSVSHFEVVPSKKRNKVRKSLPSNMNVHLKNYYEPLQLNEDSAEIDMTYMIGKNTVKTNQVMRKQRTLSLAKRNCPQPRPSPIKNKKILLCADSHGRNLAWHINNKLKSSYECIGFVRPGAGIEQVLNRDNIVSEIENDDILVIFCGTNDVARNEAAKVIMGVKETVKYLKNNKIILIDIPNRYDLVKWSCVNKEVMNTNESLRSITREHSNVVLVEASKADRNLHTRHGMHFNNWGKRWLAERICTAIEGGDSASECVETLISLTDDFSSSLMVSTTHINDVSLSRSQEYLLGDFLSPEAVPSDRERLSRDDGVGLQPAPTSPALVPGNEPHTVESPHT
ncbi:hypothetical protein LSTR_LSTR015514 [Laodelphax striatellus]|uniref:PHD-type domain-containing protein n=1 Tax=Laodelphax striatellus TaxID=195883 RepID=A0A482XLD6_LAOST|nr:hypothetical protein LSTR_LSTR015514 [Laodelphax striatellus]